MIARLLVVTSVLVGCLTAVSGTPTLLRKDGKIQAKLHLQTQRSQWIRSGGSKRFQADGDTSFDEYEADATNLSEGNTFVVNFKDGDWTIEPSSVKYNKKRCGKGRATVVVPDEARKELKSGPLVFNLCAGDGVELKSKSGSRKSNTTFETFVLKRSEGSAWSKLKLHSAKPAFRVFIADSYKSQQSGNSLLAAYHTVLETKPLPGRPTIQRENGAMQGHLQLAYYGGYMRKSRAGTLSPWKTWQYTEGSQTVLTGPVGRIVFGQYFMLDFEQNKDWTIRPVLESSKRCVDGVAPVDFPKGTREHEEDYTGKGIATNFKFYVCPGDQVQIHKNLVTDDFGKYAIFKLTSDEADDPTLPAMKVVLRNNSKAENKNPSQDEAVPIVVRYPTKYIPELVAGTQQ